MQRKIFIVNKVDLGRKEDIIEAMREFLTNFIEDFKKLNFVFIVGWIVLAYSLSIFFILLRNKGGSLEDVIFLMSWILVVIITWKNWENKDNLG